MNGPGRFRAAADLSYHLQQAQRHAIMLETYLTHGLDTADVLLMLAHDVDRSIEALTAYRDAALLRNKGIVHDTPQ